MKAIIFLALLALGSNVSGRSVQEACNSAVCQLPDCRCAAIRHPGYPGLGVADIPQIVYLTFDDGITKANYDQLYSELFDGSRLNPNHQTISGTFFACHENNDYSITHDLWRNGHEIALHSITHTASTDYWKNLDKEGWVRQFVDQKEQMATFAAIPQGDIKGYRAPLLQGGGDTMYEALQNDFEYESSRPTWNLRPVLFPYTADFDTIQDCQIAPCPTKSYPGFWVSPLVDLIGMNEAPCAFADTCVVPETRQGVKNWFLAHFLEHYNGRRAPFGIYTHAAWMNNSDLPHIRGAYFDFIDELLTYPDVFIVSIDKGLDWQKAPVSVEEILEGGGPESWQPADVKPNECDFTYNCIFPPSQTPPGIGEKTMKVCDVCPPYYPWLNNHLGLNPPSQVM